MRSIYLGAREVEEVEEIMKRYYYTCPLQAAYMAKEFGMIFFTPEDEEYNEEIYADGNVECAFEFDGVERLYIHPDSVHMLEPKTGDVITSLVTEYGYVVPSRIAEIQNGNLYSKSCDGRKWIPYGGKSRIIQRNAKPFFWPEVE